MQELCTYQENESKTHLQKNSNRTPDSPTTQHDETCDWLAHDRASLVPYQSCHLVQYETIKCKRDHNKRNGMGPA